MRWIAGRLQRPRGREQRAAHLGRTAKPLRRIRCERLLNTGAREKGSTEPDYSIPDNGFTNWVNLKSDLIDDKAADARAAAKTYLDAAALEAKNLPPGDKYSLDFIRTPKDQKTVREMIDILFAKGSPIYRVKIGMQWYDANGKVTP